MGQTFAEKLLARKAGLDTVQPGQIVEVSPDYVLSHDNTAAIVNIFNKIGVGDIFNKNQPVITLDHCVPAANETHATNHRKVREFVLNHEIENFFDIHMGISHQVLPENGFVFPGGLILGADSHTTTAGAFGAFSAGIGRSEVAVIFATGKLWLKIPESIKINLTGNFSQWVSAKDLILNIIGDVGSDGALYKSVEFSGEALKNLSISYRMTLANMSAEMGAKNCFVTPDEKTSDWLEGKTKLEYDPIYPDEDAHYENVLRYDISEIEPTIACPDSVDNVTSVKNVSGKKVDQVLIGTCTNGRIDDFTDVVSVLAGRTISQSTRLIVFPASQKVYLEALNKGLIEKLAQSGAVIMNTGCGPCLGAHEGVLAPGEVCVSTSSRNFRGRMGCKDAEIYLTSPAAAAATALTGKITDPRDVI